MCQQASDTSSLVAPASGISPHLGDAAMRKHHNGTARTAHVGAASNETPLIPYDDGPRERYNAARGHSTSTTPDIICRLFWLPYKSDG